MSSPVEYAQKIDSLLQETDRTAADAALKIARELFEYRSSREVVSNAWAGWPGQSPEEKPSNSFQKSS